MNRSGIGEDVPPDARTFLEQRRSPMAGYLVGTIAALLTSAFVWMAWAEVDEVVKGQGRVEPAGRVKLINHTRGGKVAEIHVEEGQRVTAGTVLVTFDPEIGESEQAELIDRWQVSAAEVARLTAEANGESIRFDPVLAGARPDLYAQQTSLMRARAEARDGRRDALERAVQARRSEAREAAAEVSRLRNSLSLIRQQYEAVRDLAERGLYPRLKAVELERQVGDLDGERAKAEAALAAAQAGLAESESQLAGLDKDWRSAILDDLGNAMAERDRLRKQLDTKNTVLADLVIRAPVDGIVQELVLSAAGQSVAPNEPLMKLVPVGEGLVVKARIANEDIGRVDEGMPATVKVRAYDFQRYGSLQGTVEQIAADASRASEEDEGPTYGVTVLTASDRLGSGEGHAIVPGMVVDVEFKVGQRTILSYLTDTILAVQDRAFREG